MALVVSMPPALYQTHRFDWARTPSELTCRSPPLQLPLQARSAPLPAEGLCPMLSLRRDHVRCIPSHKQSLFACLIVRAFVALFVCSPSASILCGYVR